MTGFNVIMIGFLFGIGFVIANTLLAIIDTLLAYILLKYKPKGILPLKSKNKPPEGLNFGSKLK